MADDTLLYDDETDFDFDEDHDIDQRFADRRDEVARQHRRRLLRRLGVLIAVLAIVGVGVALTRSSVLDVDRVEVRGADRTGTDAVLTEAGIAIGVPMVSLDIDQVSDAIADLPWVASVEIQRVWPATVEIEIDERRAIAVVDAGDERWQLVDESGRVLEEVDNLAEELELVGVEPAAGPGERITGGDDLLEVALVVPAGVREKVFAVAWEDGEIQLWMDPAGLVRLGDTTSLEQKLVAAETLFAQVDNRCLAVMDVRVPSAPTINRIPTCAEPATTTTASVVPNTAPATTLPATTFVPASVPSTASPTVAPSAPSVSG